jgi:hypothetical protein
MKVGPIGCHYTSVINYKSTLRNILEEWMSSFFIESYVDRNCCCGKKEIVSCPGSGLTGKHQKSLLQRPVSGPKLNPWCPEQTEKCCMLDSGAVCSVHVSMAGGCIAVGEEGGRAQLSRGWVTKTKAGSCLCSRQAACNICTNFLRPVPSGCRVAALLLVQLRTRLQLLPRRCLGNAYPSCTMRSLTVGHFK